MAAKRGNYTQFDKLFGRPNLGPAAVVPMTFGVGDLVASGVLAANDAIYCLAVAPCKGTLKDLLCYNGATGAGNSKGSVYVLDEDGLTFNNEFTGAATANTTNAWLNLGDPDVGVEAGQILLLSVADSENTTLYGKFILPHAGAATLPDDFILDAEFAGLSFPLGSVQATEFASPAATVVLADVTATAYIPVLLARVEPFDL